MTDVSGPPLICRECGSTTPVRITREFWDALDQVVVGNAMCAGCGTHSLFARYLTPAEAAVLQQDGAAVRGGRAHG